VKVTARKNIMNEHGFKVFTEGHTYDVMLDKGEVLAVYCDLKAMYNLRKEELTNFQLIE
jgi:hypothetical protein